MTVSIGRRVQEAIDYMEKGEFELALTPTAIAIDCTAKAYYGKDKHSGKNYKSFLQENLKIIQFLGLPGIMLDELILPIEFPEISAEPLKLSDFIYHYIRCNLIHDTGLTDRVVFHRRVAFGVIDEKLYLSYKLIWGLLGTVIICPVNKGENVPEFYWFAMDEFRYFVNDLWGRMDIIERVMKLKMGSNLALNPEALKPRAS